MQKNPQEYKSKKQKKSVAMTTLVARCCRKTNQLQSVRGMENKEPIKIFVSQKKEKSVAMATLVARCCQKANQLQSVQGYGKQKNP